MVIFAANLAIVERLEAVAAAKTATPAQVALAWVHAQGEDVVPIPGTKRRRSAAISGRKSRGQ
jgi:aryl-alcohol dehydrogenase-like predicted oxidoreductase